MPKILRTSASRKDYVNIHDFIARESPQSAAMILRVLKDKVRLLSNNPALGLGRPELGLEVRSWPAHNFILFYRPIEDGIVLLRVLHGSLDISQRHLANL